MTNSRAGKKGPIFAFTSQTDQSVTSSTTLVDATGFTFQADANATYYYKIFMVITGHASGDMKIDWTIPSGAAMHCLTLQSPTAPSAQIDMTTELTVQTTTTIENLYFTGKIQMSSTPGEVKMQFAQAVSNGTATILRKGSHMEVWKSA